MGFYPPIFLEGLPAGPESHRRAVIMAGLPAVGVAGWQGGGLTVFLTVCLVGVIIIFCVFVIKSVLVSQFFGDAMLFAPCALRGFYLLLTKFILDTVNVEATFVHGG